MARISSYNQDDTLNKLDKVIGTDSITGNTKNYTINSMLQLVNQEGLVEAFDGASFAFVDYIPSSENPRGVINLNGGVATQANFSDISQLYISTVDKTGLSINEYLDNSLNNQIKVSLKGNMNQFGIYEVTAISSHDDGAYKILTLTPRAHNGILTVYDDFFLSNYSAVFDQNFDDNSVTEFGDVSDAGSGEIITDDERESLNNFTNNGLLHSDVVDNVTSTSTDVPLSANQGKVLKGLIDAINTLLTSDNVDLDTLQEVVNYIETNRDTLDTLGISNISGLQAALDSKQNTETGKGLSANDFTDELLIKLNNIAAEAEVNVNADWSSSTGDSEILNKPTDLTNLSIHNVAELSDVTSAGSGAIITDDERIKLNAIDVDLTERTVTDGTNSITVPPANAEQNVNADWEASSGDAEILNKPALAPSNAQPNVQSDWGEDDVASDAFILNKPTDVTDLTQHNAIDLADIDSIGSGDIITDGERTKLNNIEAGAQVNVQADWDATDSALNSFILNKPDVTVTKTKVDTALGIADADDSYFYRGDGTWADPLSDITLGDLTDVRADTTDPGINEGFVLRWNPAMDKWIGSSYYLEDLDNVATNQSNSIGKVLAVTGFNSQNSTNSYDAVELTINSLGDFNITSPSNNQILQYNDSTSHWENSSDLALPGTLEFTETQSTTPSFDNGIYVSTEDGHDTMHFRYHGHDLSIDYLTQVLPTGILDGGVLSKANNTQFTIAAGDGIINNLNKAANSDPHPEIVKVAWGEQTITVANLDTNETDQLNSWIYVDSTGTVRQQSTAFTDAQKRSNIIIGSAIHSEGVLKFVKTFPHTGYNNASQMNEFAGIFGPMKKSGHRITANGANLSIDRAAGVAFALGRNYANDPENPSTVSDGAKTQCVIHRYYGDGNDGFILDDGVNGAGYTTLDPTKYDDGTGTLATVSGGHYSVQRLYYFPSTPDIIVAYYGGDEYNAMDLAEKSYSLEDFTEAPNTSDQAIFVGSVILAGSTTDLTASAKAKFLTAGAFRGLAAVTVGGAIAGSSLNDLSDVNLQNLSDAEVLRYNSSTQQFENVSDSVLPITLDTTNNRVGINETTPTHNLHVVGNAKITGDVALDSNIAATGTVTGSNLNISNWDTAYGWGDHSTEGYLTVHPDITAAANSSNSGRTYIQSITVDSNGHILSMATGSETVVNTDTIDMGDGFKIQNSSGADQFTITENDGLRIEGAGTTSVSFDSATNKITVNSANADLSPITLDSTNSRVGIGTASPSEKLDVNGNIVADNIKIASSILHEGDTDTNISFTNNQISTNVGGGKSLKFGNNSVWLEESDSSNFAALIEGVSYGARFNMFGDGVNTIRLLGDGDNFINSGNVGIGTTSPAVSLDINATDAIIVPKGTNAERDALTGEAGMFRFNTTENEFEGYNGTEWGAIAGSGGGGSGEIVKETFNGTGSQASFILGDAITDIDNINVYVNGVYQYPSNYTVTGNTVTFVSGSIPASGTGNVHVRHNVTAPTLTEGAVFSTSGNLTGDGSTRTFALGGSPRSSDHVMVFLEGVYQEKENYSISGSNITFTTAPPNGYSIEAKYVTGILDLTSVGEVTLREYVGDGNTSTYALDTTPTSEAYVDAYIEGVYQEKGTYIVSGSNIVFDSNIPNGYSIELKTIGTIPNSSVTQTTFVSDEFTASGSTNNFTLVNGSPSSKSLTMVFIQGVYQSKSNYNLVSSEIQFTATPDEDDVIEVISMSAVNTAGSPVTSVNGEVGAVTVASKHNVSVISANTTAVANTLYVFTANLNLTLPASPAMGDSIKISNRSTVDTCQLLRNGNNILGAAEDLTLDTASSSFELVYTDTANGWVIIGQ